MNPTEQNMTEKAPAMTKSARGLFLRQLKA